MSDLTPEQIAEGWRIAHRQIDNLTRKLHAVRAERDSLKAALEDAGEALRHARDGLDFGLGYARRLADDWSPVPLDRRVKLADGYLRQARQDHRKVHAALAAVEPVAAADRKEGPQ